MDWRIKAAALRAFDAAPWGEAAHYWIQRHLSRKLPRSGARLARAVDQAIDLARRYAAHATRPMAESTFLEFGAGRDLAGPLAFYCLGAGRQIVLDTAPLAKPDLVDGCIERLAAIDRDAFVRRPAHRLGRDAWGDLEAHYGIRYETPGDARATGLPGGSVDCVTSTNTLEHVPVDDIRAILRESRRILRPGGRAVMMINYEDHYAFFDKSITTINFLRYSDRAWRKFNPANHYQNRLRHRDYLALFEEAGFAVLDVEVLEAGSREIEAARRLPLDPRFRGYSAEDLGVRTGWVVLG